MAMDSSSPFLHHDDHISSIRRRNKILIITFFSLIILLALITGGIIISFVQKINSDATKSNRAIRAFCTPFGEFQSHCVTLLSSEIKAPSNTNPNHILMLSLQISLKKLFKIIPILPDCSNSLTHATGQISKILEIIRVDPDVETYQRGNMTAWIATAGNDLTACVTNLTRAKRTAAAAREMVDEARAVVMYCRDFLRNCENVNYDFSLVDHGGEKDSWVEDLATVSMFFGSQYCVLVFLFCLLLRIYYCKK